MSFVTQLAHHGMIFVPTGYHTPDQFQMDEIMGGSAYGAGTYAAGDGSRMPSEKELARAKLQGEGFAKIAAKLSS